MGFCALPHLDYDSLTSIHPLFFLSTRLSDS